MLLQITLSSHFSNNIEYEINKSDLICSEQYNWWAGDRVQARTVSLSLDFLLFPFYSLLPTTNSF
jgi:hypothetical protein